MNIKQSIASGSILSFASLCVLAFAVSGAAQTEETTVTERVWPVRAVSISPSTHTIDRDFSGSIKSPTAMDLSFSRAGCIIEVADGLMGGSRVRAGQTLFRLDDREMQINHQIAEATAFEHEQTVAEQKVSLQAARDNYERKKASLARAQAFLERDRELAERNLISASVVEENQRSVWGQEDIAAAALDSLRQAEAATARIEASLARVNAELESSLLALELHTLKAPFDGTMVDVVKRAGACVQPGERLATLADPKAREAKTFISLSVLQRGDGTQPGIGKSAVVSKANGKTCGGTITSLDGSVEENSQSVAVTLSLEPDCADQFLINEAVRVRLTVREIPDAVALPVSALREDNTVFLIDEDQRLKTASLTFSFIFDGVAYVRFDSGNSEFIVLSPPPLAVDGMKVLRSRSE